jgi:hypothetical protein
MVFIHYCPLSYGGCSTYLEIVNGVPRPRTHSKPDTLRHPYDTEDVKVTYELCTNCRAAQARQTIIETAARRIT